VVSSPNSINGKKRAWWLCLMAASTAPLSSLTCSASPAPPVYRAVERERARAGAGVIGTIVA